jgi:hypothetical protein
MLCKLLVLDPRQRITAAEALKDPMFDDVRDDELEQKASIKVEVPIEEAGMFDYE